MVVRIRPVNVFLVGVTQMLFWFFLVLPVFVNNNVSPVLNTSLFTIMMTMTMLITAGGYVHNDMVDIKTDEINKPEKALKNKSRAQQLYLILNVLALICSFYIFYRTNSFNILALCATCIIVLWTYSKYFKSTILMGNVVVSLLIGLVPFMFIIVESEAFTQLKQANIIAYSSTFLTILSFTIFAFLANLIREIVKDCEDFEGDFRSGIVTLATALGHKKADLFSQALTITLLIFAIIWLVLKKLWLSYIDLSAFTFLIFLPTLYLFYLLTKRVHDKSKYSKISNHVKLLMAFGLIYLLIHLNISYA